MASTITTNNGYDEKVPIKDGKLVIIGFDELKDKMDKFTLNFNDALNSQRKQLLNERTQHTAQEIADQESIRLILDKIKKLQTDKDQAGEYLAQHQIEIANEEASLSKYSQTKSDMDHVRITLLDRIDRLKAAMEAKHKEHAKEKQKLAHQQSQNGPELDFWQDCLGMTIFYGGGPDLVKFTFNNIDAKDWKRDFSFVIDTSLRDYQVSQCNPEIDSKRLQEIVMQLNKTRQFNGFLCHMRNAFKELSAS